MANVTLSNPKPSIIGIQKTSAIFQADSITYSQAGIKYSQAGLFWGGSDKKGGVGPTMLGVQTVKPNNIGANTFPMPKTFTITLQAGQPMGLLWALTYPTTTTEQSLL